ncbi:exopolysaccharide biosynthesis polyprenyl glycosylphosphotransferase [Stenoxybacter acetivorans]|uniref:exopolysaccharide biosynthesis polyprenyl glycosylphosphotransferase n=1 Tax=Stenoxybacter acetivorans TaxID=422441 RepID=UPI00068AF579|nr:exopolysaccharide biosynthesis polyprenyl glycosylphosphotransferase [Stenoxybacter acetivorans]
MNNLFVSFSSRLFFGTLIAACLPMAVLDPILGFYQGKEAFTVSILLSGTAHFFNAKSLYVLSNYPGRTYSIVTLPHTFFWYFGSWMTAKFFNLPYSVWFLFLGGCTSLALCLAGIVYRNPNKQIYAYLPFGYAKHAEHLPNAVWIRLTEPKLIQNNITAIVADLHDPNLDAQWQHFLAQQTLNGMPVYHIRRVEEVLTGRVKIRHLYENELGSLLPSPTYALIKRILDMVLVVFSLPIALPIMLIAALAIKYEGGGKVLFIQNRVGQGGKEFRLYKLRSMAVDSEQNGAKLAAPNDTRITRVGQFIRKTRIDELPQFFNVFKGNMSLIGPRPEQQALVTEFEQRLPFYSYRHIVKPGISGWAQVTQGYAGDENETQIKIEHDFYYIKHFSFSLDLLIFFKTLKTIFTGFGAR